MTAGNANSIDIRKYMRGWKLLFKYEEYDIPVF